MPQRLRTSALLLAWLLAASTSCASPAVVKDEAAEVELQRWMAEAGAVGLGIAVLERGEIIHLASHGLRNAQRPERLDPDTVLYAASLTKAVFAVLVLQLVDEGLLQLDSPLDQLLPKALPDYKAYADLAGDPRWRQLTPRLLLAHGSGWLNFRWLDADEKLRFHADPGSGYHYSGEGINLLQFVLEQGLGLDVEAELQHRLFGPLGLTRSGLRWNPAWAANSADGHALDGRIRPHAQRRSVRAAGSMDSSLRDQARLWAAIAQGWGLSPASRAALVAVQLPIRSQQQFPTFGQPERPALAALNFAAGLGVIRLDNGDGTLWFKGGHDDFTGNQLVCHDGRQRCVLLMANDVRAEALFPRLVERWLGPTRLPWDWEYADWRAP